MNLKTFFDDSRVHVGFTLFLVWLLDLWHFRYDPNLFQIILYPLLSILTVAVFDVAAALIRQRKLYLPTAALVSGFLIGLILSPSEHVYVILLASILASLSKQFLAVGIRQHIFNPAAFGIVSASLIFGTTVSWWGVAWGFLPLIVLIPLMARILLRLKRLFLPVGFLIIYGIYLLVFNSAEFAIRTLVDQTVVMFALVMLPEPMTSPASGYFKYSFGVMVAIGTIVIERLTTLSEVFLPALLVVNILSFVYLKFKAKLKTVVR